LDSAKKTAVALRSQVISPSEIVKLSKVLDQSVISTLFIPDLPGVYDSLEISAACLGVSKGLHAGSGVFRPLEHDLQQLVRRLSTLQSLSENRYIMGVGTGSPGPYPGEKVSLMLQRLDEIRTAFKETNDNYPECYIAALRLGIAKRVAGKCDGILLNFCPPQYAKMLVDALRKSFSGNLEISCYLKVFYSPSEAMARKLGVEEFVKYNSFPQYHAMFEAIGLSQDILSASRTLGNNDVGYPESLRVTSPINPSIDELRTYVTAFRDSGITLPCVYPYFADGESFEFKHETVRNIISAAE